MINGKYLGKYSRHLRLFKKYTNGLTDFYIFHIFEQYMIKKNTKCSEYSVLVTPSAFVADIANDRYKGRFLYMMGVDRKINFL